MDSDVNPSAGDIDPLEKYTLAIPLTLKTSENYNFFVKYEYSRVNLGFVDSSEQHVTNNAFVAGLKILF